MEAINTELIGKRLKHRRKMMSMTQKDLASMVSIHWTTVSRYEKGEIKDCKMPVLESFARALNCNPAWLMGYDVEMEVPQPIGHAKNQLAAGIFEKVTGLNEENLQKVDEYIDLLLMRQNKE